MVAAGGEPARRGEVEDDEIALGDTRQMAAPEVERHGEAGAEQDRPAGIPQRGGRQGLGCRVEQPGDGHRSQ